MNPLSNFIFVRLESLMHSWRAHLGSFSIATMRRILVLLTLPIVLSVQAREVFIEPLIFYRGLSPPIAYTLSKNDPLSLFRLHAAYINA